jgi:integrative and conjugative element protein (TIGR02256 family)
MREYAAAAFPLETGGALIGRYVDASTADVASVTGPCADARHEAYGFERGTAGLREVLDDAWERGLYYLGEWHTHPASDPSPSRDDLATMRRFAADPAMSCPEPLLLILGGRAGEASERWSATVCTAEEPLAADDVTAPETPQAKARGMQERGVEER